MSSQRRYDISDDMMKEIPALVLMESSARAAICGYPVWEDELMQCTPQQLLKFKNIAWTGDWSEEPALRCWDVEGKRVYGMWGWQEGVVAVIYGLLGQHGFRRVVITLPTSSSGKFNFYIIGCRPARK